MKILLTSATGYPTKNTGGPNKVLLSLLNGLKKYEKNVDYFSKNYQNISNQDSIDQQENYNKKLWFDLYQKNRFYRSIVSHPLYLQFHYHKMRKFFNSKVDSLSGYECINSHDVLSSYFLRKCKGKKILSIHSKGTYTDELKSIFRTGSFSGKRIVNKIGEMERISFDEASSVVFPSVAAKNMFLESAGKNDSNKIKVIYNGIDPVEFNKIKKDDKIFDVYNIPKSYSRYILNVANHIKEKNIDKIIYALDLLVKKYKENICLINAGIGPLTSILKNQVRNLNLDNNVFFLNMIPNEDIIKLMKNCDYFIMTSEYVVFDMAILEAMASGIIVLASFQGGNKEIIEDSINGYFLFNNEPDEIALKVLEADKMVVDGAIKTVESFSISRMVDTYFKLYTDVISQN